jgi:hypothetical protein
MPVLKLENGARLITPADDAGARTFVEAANFTLEWLVRPGEAYSLESDQETLVLFSKAGGTIQHDAGVTPVPPMTIAIIPPGRCRITAEAAGAAMIVATGRADLDRERAINAGETRDQRIAPLGRPFVRSLPLTGPILLPIESIPVPEGNPRIRFLQTATISINIVLYDGPRGKAALSPHSHDDIEQGTLAIDGDYVHHLRTPWGPNGHAWLDDVHLDAGPGSIVLIPPGLIHTTEGVHAGSHLLLDIFAPPRRDFIGRGWVFNARDYAPPVD